MRVEQEYWILPNISVFLDLLPLGRTKQLKICLDSTFASVGALPETGTASNRESDLAMSVRCREDDLDVLSADSPPPLSEIWPCLYHAVSI